MADLLRAMMGSTMPDLIFLDRNLPRCSGFYVLRDLNSEGVTRQTPVVHVYFRINGGGRQQALDLGSREVIIKALDLDSLIKSIKGGLQARVTRRRSIKSVPES